MKRRYLLLFYGLLLFVFSCRNDDDSTGMSDPEINAAINLDLYNYGSNVDGGFVMVTDEFGYRYFDEVFSGNEYEKAVPVSNDRRTDVTVGFKRDNKFEMHSFLGVKDKVGVYGGFSQNCESDFFNYHPFVQIDIIVENIEFEAVAQTGITGSTNDSTISNGVILKERYLSKDANDDTGYNVLLCLKDATEEAPKCTVFNNSLVEGNQIVLNFEDFFEPEVHTLSLSPFDKWGIEASVLSGDSIFALARHRYYRYPYDATAEILLPPGLQIDKVLLSGDGRAQQIGSTTSFQRKFDSWPTSIELSVPGIVDFEGTSNSVNVSLPFESDFNNVSVSYDAFNRWQINNVNSQSLSFVRPDFSDKIINAYPTLVSSFAEARSFTVSYHEGIDAEIENFVGGNFYSYFRCSDYDSRSEYVSP